MSVRFTKSDVNRHLVDLGYTNVTEDQLIEFVVDLKRLMRYDEKQKRFQEQLGVVETEEKSRDQMRKTRRRSASTSSAYSSSSSHAVADEEGGEAVYTPNFKATRRRRQVVQVDKTRDEVDHSQTGNTTSVSSSSSSTTADNVQIRVNVNEASSSLASSQSQSLTSLNERSKRPASASRSGLILLGKPTTSFITPAARQQKTASKNIRCDPVRLHQYYKAQWAKTKFPGDDSNKQVRWAVREWMVGHMD
jgi:hypothetical protein